jgi:preprotein translocase subunit SecF
MINWMKYRFLYFALSLLVIVPGVWSLVTYGLKLSIDFTGGSLLVLDKVTSQRQEVLAASEGFAPTIISQEGEVLTLRLKDISQEDVEKIVSSLKKENQDVTVLSFEALGPALGQETLKKTLYAIILATSLLLIHISRAFKNIKFGVCAILAMLHDTLVLLGSFSLLGHFFGVETDLLFVTAALTVLSFSVHDTIVVYDRIRELGRRAPNLPTEELANKAVSETMIRSLNNSLTIIFMLLALFLLGGETTKYFALALLIGTVSGSYSSPFTAVPLLVTWDKLKKT